MNLNEIKNQHVHLFWSVMINIILFIILRHKAVLISGFLTGICVELYQMIVKGEGLNIDDRVIDLFFWGIGSGLSLLIVLFL